MSPRPLNWSGSASYRRPPTRALAFCIVLAALIVSCAASAVSRAMDNASCALVAHPERADFGREV